MQCTWEPLAQFLSPGTYLGHRLRQAGCDTVFVVPGDFNLPVLDALAQVPGLRVVNCNNELTCAYAADGYARAKPDSLGCCITTFLVGALSAINGVAGSFAEEVPVLHIVGVPATFQYSGQFLSLHHTLGNAENMSQEVDCYRPVTCYQTILRSFVDARYLIDKALTKCLTHRKPVLLEVCRDLPMVPHSSFGRAPPHMTPFGRPRSVSDPAVLQAAVKATQRFFADKQMPLIVLGRRARLTQQTIVKLADALGFGAVVLHDAKGMFPEDHPSFLGVYSPFYTSPVSVKQCYEAADAILLIGTHFNEFSHPAPDQALEQRSVLAYKSHVLVGHTDAFNGINTADFLDALAGCLQPNNAAVRMFRSLPALQPELTLDPHFVAPPEAPLKMAYVMQQIQEQLLAPDEGGTDDGGGGGGPAGSSQGMAVMVDTGDSMLRTQMLKLPGDTRYEVQMFAANIGWAPAAGLGYSLGLGSSRRLLVICGDGGLQMTSGAIGDYVKCDSNAIFFCVNNNGYLIERYLSPIIEASYNYVQQWDYALLAQAMCNKGGGKYRVFKVATEAEAAAAIRQAKQLSDHFVFIEVLVDKHDAAPASSALRAGFMTRHFSNIAGYKYLNLGAVGGAAGSEAVAAAAASSLTGHDQEDNGASAGVLIGGCTSGVVGAAGAGGGLAAFGRGAAPAAAAAAASGSEQSGLSVGVGPAAADSGGDPPESQLQHSCHPHQDARAAGSSNCLVAVLGEAEQEAEAQAPTGDGVEGGVSTGGGGGRIIGGGGGSRYRGASRLGLLLPAKRHAEGEADGADGDL